MKSYDFTICFQSIRYHIHDDGVLEYLERNGKIKKTESHTLSNYNPIPDKKKKNCPYAGFLLFLFFLTLILNLINLALIYFFHTGYAKTVILAVFPFIFLIPLALRETIYCFPSFSDTPPLIITVGYRENRKSAEFLRELRRAIAKHFRAPEANYENREAFLEAIREMRENRLLTDSEIHVITRQYENHIPFTPLHTFVVLDVLRMDGVISEEEYQEMKYERIFHPNP
ncbi:MAG: hypothetical protein ACI4UV_13520 [Victivallales bacterium]